MKYDRNHPINAKTVTELLAGEGAGSYLRQILSGWTMDHLAAAAEEATPEPAGDDEEAARPPRRRARRGATEDESPEP